MWVNMREKMIKSAVRLGQILTMSALFFSMAEARSGKLAIVIDDVGYSHQYDQEVFAMPTEIAVAIIPVAPYAKARHQQAVQQGRNILIHLPMQPRNNQKIEEGGLHLGMSRQTVAHRVLAAKTVLPKAIGLNNHMGSAATADQTLMSHLMEALKQHHLAFLDSKTIGSSVAAKTAKQHGIQSLERHIFLDDSDRYEDVQRQFQLAINYARKNGTAIMIGHPRKNTVAVLQQQLRQLPADIRLVSMQALWQGQSPQEPTSAPPFIYIFGEQTVPTSVGVSFPCLQLIPQSTASFARKSRDYPRTSLLLDEFPTIRQALISHKENGCNIAQARSVSVPFRSDGFHP